MKVNKETGVRTFDSLKPGDVFMSLGSAFIKTFDLDGKNCLLLSDGSHAWLCGDRIVEFYPRAECVLEPKQP